MGEGRRGRGMNKCLPTDSRPAFGGRKEAEAAVAATLTLSNFFPRSTLSAEA